MTKVSRKGFVDKNGQQVVIVPNVPGATAGNLASFDAEGNLQDCGKAIDQSPTENSTNLVTSGGVMAAINEVNERIGIPIIIINLGRGSGDSYYFLYGNGEDTNTMNINSVKDFIQATQQNTIVHCNVHVIHGSGSSGTLDDEYNIPGYAMWSLSDNTIKVRLVVQGYVFECQVIGDLDDADSYSDYWIKTSFSL